MWEKGIFIKHNLGICFTFYYSSIDFFLLFYMKDKFSFF